MPPSSFVRIVRIEIKRVRKNRISREARRGSETDPDGSYDPPIRPDTANEAQIGSWDDLARLVGGGGPPEQLIISVRREWSYRALSHTVHLDTS